MARFEEVAKKRKKKISELKEKIVSLEERVFKQEKIVPFGLEDDFHALLSVAKCLNGKQERVITTKMLAKEASFSQQTASRRLKGLVSNGWITREFGGRSSTISLTDKGIDLLLELFKETKRIIKNLRVTPK